MPEGLPGDQPQICACPGCDEVVVQSESGNTRLYHSAECRRKARRLRHEDRSAATSDLPPAADEEFYDPAQHGPELPNGTTHPAGAPGRPTLKSVPSVDRALMRPAVASARRPMPEAPPVMRTVFDPNFIAARFLLSPPGFG